MSYLTEEDYDRIKDRRLERGGVDGNNNYPSKPSGASTQKDPKKEVDLRNKALEMVKANIANRHGANASIGNKQESASDNSYLEPDMKKRRENNQKAIDDMKKTKAHADMVKTARKAMGVDEEVVTEAGDYWHPDPAQDRKLGGPGANQRAREDRTAASTPKQDPKKLRPGESYMDYAKRHSAPAPSKSSSDTSPKPSLTDRIKNKVGKVLDNAIYGNKQKTEGVSFGEFMIEGNKTARMLNKSQTKVTGHISADRGGDESENRKKRKGLEQDLKKQGIGHTKGVGEYKYGDGETGREVSYQTSKPDKMSKRRFGKTMRKLGRKHGQESVITKDSDKSAKLHYTEKGSTAKSDTIGKSKAGKHPEGYGETSGTKVRSSKLPSKTNKGAYHYG